jgi:VanZ family protein
LKNDSPHRLDQRPIAILCLIAVVAILCATLWPFNPWPVNQVTWLPDGNGIQIGHDGVVVSERPLQPPPEPSSRNSCSLELLLRTGSVQVSDTILGFYVPEHSTHLLVRQWTDGLLISHDSADAQGKVREAELDVNHAFRVGELLLVTITSGPSGTLVYRNATHAQSFPKFTISRNELAGQIVLGTSPVGYRPWTGEVRGLAIYSKELTAAEVSRDYAGWTAVGAAHPPNLDVALARYPFNERTGREIHSSVPTAPTLEIPVSFNVPHKAMLKSAVKEYDPNRLYVKDILANIAGFVPLGAIFGVYFSLQRSRVQAILNSTLVGAFLSFAIEILQAYIPRRFSGTTDIITNTLGALLGAAITNPSLVRKILRSLRLLPAS